MILETGLFYGSIFCKMDFFVRFEEWAETPQCDVSTDINRYYDSPILFFAERT